MAIDGLSDLPDSLLLHIMSFMYMKSVVRTSLLSKRWRHLWKSIFVMDFDWLGPDDLGFVDRSIALHQGSKIRKFRVCGEHDDFRHERVDSWVLFAVRCNVEELHLNFKFYPTDDELSDDDMSMTPECVFKCKSLVSLKLSRCEITLPGSTYLPWLTTLKLSWIQLDTEVLKELINGCPSLEDLTLRECNRFSDLDIHDENGRLKRLKLIEWGDAIRCNTPLQIFAPNLLSLEFVEDMPRKSYEVKDLSSLAVASFNFAVLLNNSFDYTTDHFLELVDQIRHVKLLEICTLCMAELSVREMRGPSASVTYSSSTLALKTGFHKFDLMGLAYIMRSFTNLEVLIIDMENAIESNKFVDWYFSDEEDEFDENEVWKSIVTSFTGILKHLKSVKICGLFMETEHVAPNSAYEDIETQRYMVNKEAVETQRYLLAQMTNEEVIEDILKGQGSIIQFIRVLLTNSAVLETLTITTKFDGCYANCDFIW